MAQTQQELWIVTWHVKDSGTGQITHHEFKTVSKGVQDALNDAKTHGGLKLDDPYAVEILLLDKIWAKPA